MLHAGIDFPDSMKTQLGMDAAASRATDKKCDLLELLRLATVTDDRANQIRPLITEYPILVYKWRRVVRLNPTLRLGSSGSREVWTDISVYERSIDFDLKTCYRVRNTIVHDAAIDVLQLDRVCQRLNWLLCAMLDTILHQFARNPSLALSQLYDVNLRWFTDWKDQLKDDANPVTLDEVLFPRVRFLR